MRKYDFARAKALIEASVADGAVSADLGMAEDWFWTAEVVWHRKEGFTRPMEGRVAGIHGSVWATPTLVITYNDEREVRYECFTGEVSDPRPM